MARKKPDQDFNPARGRTANHSTAPPLPKASNFLSFHSRQISSPGKPDPWVSGCREREPLTNRSPEGWWRDSAATDPALEPPG